MTNDSLVWLWNEKCGEVSTKSTYDAIVFSLLEVHQQWWYLSF